MTHAAGLARRLAAAGYDLLPLTGLFAVATLVVVLALGGAAVPAGNPLFRLMLLAIAGLFFVGSWARGGQTIGMRAWRLRVETLDGGPLTWRMATLRYIAALGSLAALGLGFAWALYDRDRRTWHDCLCGTRVVVLPKTPRRR